MIKGMKLYGIYSKRGLWVEIIKGKKGGVKRVTLFGREEAEKRAAALSTEHKQAFHAKQVTLK